MNSGQGILKQMQESEPKEFNSEWTLEHLQEILKDLVVNKTSKTVIIPTGLSGIKYLGDGIFEITALGGKLITGWKGLEQFIENYNKQTNE